MPKLLAFAIAGLTLIRVLPAQNEPAQEVTADGRL